MFKALTVGLAALLIAAPAMAQTRGTLEFGGFASGAMFDQELSLKTGYGAGGRVGMFLDRRWAIEFENAEMRASRPNGLKDVNVGILSGRLVASDWKRGPFTWLVGAGGGVSTETHFLHSYGFDLMAGTKIALNDRTNLRIDTVLDFLANNDWRKYASVRVGLSWFRHPDPAGTK
jgi:hypothetical protein